MKSIVYLLVFALVFISGYTPNTAVAQTELSAEERQVLEEKRDELLRQLIVLLQMKLELLLQQYAERFPDGQVLGIDTSVTEEDEEGGQGFEEVAETPRSSGGGGGGGRRSVAPPVSGNTDNQQQEVDELLEQIEELESELNLIQELQDEIDALEALVAEREAQLDEYAEQMSSLTEEIKELEDDAELREERIRELEALVAELEAKIEDQEGDLENLQSQLDSLQIELQNKVSAIEEAEEFNQLLQQQITELQTAVSELEQLDEQNKSIIQSLSDYLNQVEIDKETLEALVLDLEVDIVAKVQRIEDMSELIGTLLEDNEELQTDVDLWLEMYSQSLIQIEQLQEALNDSETEITVLNDLVATLENEVAEQSIAINLLQAIIDNQYEQLVEKEAELIVYEDMHDQYQQMINDLLEQIGVLQSQISQYEEYIDELEAMLWPLTDLEGGEAVLSYFNLYAGTETTVHEGRTDVPVAELVMEVVGGDALMQRLDLDLRQNPVEIESQPWNNFDRISLWVDGEKIAEKDVDQSTDWIQSNDWDRIRFENLNLILREGATTEITIGVSSQDNIHGLTDVTAHTWDLQIPAGGFRMRDRYGVDTIISNNTNIVNFEVVKYQPELHEDDEIRVFESTNDPSATTIEVEDDRRSSFVNVFAFDLDALMSPNQIMIESIPVHLQLDDAEYLDVINDARLVIDGDTYREFTVDDSNSSSPILTFTFDEGLYLEGSKTAQLEIRLNAQQDNYDNGTTIQGMLFGDDIDASVGDDYLSSARRSGSAFGSVHTLYTKGLLTELVSTTANMVENHIGSSYGEFAMAIDMTAIGDDMFINESSVQALSENVESYWNDEGVVFSISSGSNTYNSDGSTSHVFTRVSGGTRVSGNGYDMYRISEGSTATFELVVVHAPEVNNQYRVQLHGVGYSSGSLSDFTLETLSPTADYRSTMIFIPVD